MRSLALATIINDTGIATILAQCISNSSDFQIISELKEIECRLK